MKKMNVKLNAKGYPVGLPFHVDMSIHDFNGNGEEFMGYINALKDQYLSEMETAEPGQPLRSAYPPDSSGEARFNAATTAWAVQQGVSQAMEAARPKQQAQGIPRELAALMHGDGADKTRSVELVQWRSRSDEQAKKAANYFALDGMETGRVRDARQRAAQYQREADKLEKQKFTFEEREDLEALKYGQAELEKFMKANPEEVEANLDHIQGLLQGFRSMSNTEYSFALDGKQVVKVHHPNIPAAELSARLGTTEDRHLVTKLQVHGIDRHDEQKPKEKEEPQGKPMNEMTMADYESYVAGENAKAQAKSGPPEIRPGMFGG